jgi:hypothetical protein
MRTICRSRRFRPESGREDPRGIQSFHRPDDHSALGANFFFRTNMRIALDHIFETWPALSLDDLVIHPALRQVCHRFMAIVVKSTLYAGVGTCVAPGGLHRCLRAGGIVAGRLSE